MEILNRDSVIAVANAVKEIRGGKSRRFVFISSA